MESYGVNNRAENRDKLKSGILTAIIWSLLLLFVFLYKFTEKIPEKKEVVTQMLINFGDNRNGNGVEEPADQPGSLASASTENIEQIPTVSETQTQVSETPVLPNPVKNEVPKEKIITGTDSKNSVSKTEKADKNAKTTPKTSSSNKDNSKNSGSKTTVPNSKTGNGDGKGNAAIGNLIKGRGTKAGSQGDGTGIGNNGDPLGGDGNGDSKIGIDRKLTGYIPGTMGRGGAQPSHNCAASGSVTISYTVDKAGNVISARRSGGISDPCVAATSVLWVKKYVKAEKAAYSSTGTYKITF